MKYVRNADPVPNLNGPVVPAPTGSPVLTPGHAPSRCCASSGRRVPVRRGIRGHLVLTAGLVAGSSLALLALPTPCLGLVLLVYVIAFVLSIVGIWNAFLWFWLIEITAFMACLRSGQDVPDGFFFIVIYVILLTFWLGVTFTLRRRINERTAMALALVLTVMHALLLGSLFEMVAALCPYDPHCSC